MYCVKFLLLPINGDFFLSALNLHKAVYVLLELTLHVLKTFIKILKEKCFVLSPIHTINVRIYINKDLRYLSSTL